MERVYRIGFRASLLALLTLAGLGCDKKVNAYVAPPPPEVTIARPVTQQVTRYFEYTGSTAGTEKVEVRARVKGFLQKMHFKPGTQVNAGDDLFTIDKSTFQVNVAQAKADLAGKTAAAENTKVQYRKAVERLNQMAGTQIEVDDWKTKMDQAVAAVDYAQALLDGANLELGFTDVKSPIDGLVGENQVDLGTLVGVSDPTLLTTVIRQDRIFAYFDVSERDVLDVTAQRLVRGDPARVSGAIIVEMELANEVGFPHKGSVDFADNTVNPQTGTLRVRGVFDNPNGALLPGLFVRLRVPQDTAPTILVPDAAVAQDQSGRYVLVVNDKGEVERRAVTAGKPIGQVRPILDGLKAEDWIIINGMLRVRPGGKVTAKQAAINPKILPAPATPPKETLVPARPALKDHAPAGKPAA